VLSVSRLLNGTATSADALRYGRSTAKVPAHLLHFSADKKPVLVWNVTQRCNLFCMHCYASSRNREYPGELTTEEGRRLLENLAQFGVPTVLFSGGEPLTRPDLFELVSNASASGLRCVLSTNGTLITPEAADKIAESGFSYVGVSLDGIGPVHDKIRGRIGAFDEALRGLRLCRDRGVRVGLRFTVHRKNLDQLPGVIDLLETEGIDRCCVYHLAYAGRGDRIRSFDLSPAETRAAIEYIFDRVQDFDRRGVDKEVLTVDNHADNVLLYLRVQRDAPERAEDVYQMLEWNGGNQSGIAIACVDPKGNVHADQFSWDYTLGNVRDRPFSEIWTDTSESRMAILKERKPYLKGRCHDCKWLSICNGNLRVRAERYFNDFLAPDPACYLTDEEIGLSGEAAALEPDWQVPVQQEAVHA
jgi:radical SAM protein with 4Fe4S-binding SPASM domain